MVLGPGIRARPFESASTLRSAFAVAVCASSMIRWHLILMAPSGGVSCRHRDPRCTRE